MRTRRRVEVQVHSLTSALDRVSGNLHDPARFNARRKALSTHSTGSRVCSRPGLDTAEKNPLLQPGMESRFLSIPTHSLDYARSA